MEFDRKSEALIDKVLFNKSRDSRPQTAAMRSHNSRVPKASRTKQQVKQ